MDENEVWQVLNRNLFFVKNVVKSREAKTSDKLDVLDPETGEVLLECGEPDIGAATKVARFIGGGHDRMAPFNLVAWLPESGAHVLRVSRGASFLSYGGSTVEFSDHSDQPICRMKKQVFSIGRSFRFFREKKDTMFVLKLKAMGKGQRLLIDGDEVGRVMSKWNEEHAEVFTSNNCSYAISISPQVPEDSEIRQLLLAFGISINRVNT